MDVQSSNTAVGLHHIDAHKKSSGNVNPPLEKHFMAPSKTRLYIHCA